MPTGTAMRSASGDGYLRRRQLATQTMDYKSHRILLSEKLVRDIRSGHAQDVSVANAVRDAFSGPDFYMDAHRTLLVGALSREFTPTLVANAVAERLRVVHAQGKRPVESDYMFHCISIDDCKSVVLHYSRCLHGSVLYVRRRVLQTSYLDLIHNSGPAEFDATPVVAAYRSLSSNPYLVWRGNVVRYSADTPSERDVDAQYLLVPHTQDTHVAIVRNTASVQGMRLALRELSVGGASPATIDFLEKALIYATRTEDSGLPSPFGNGEGVQFRVSRPGEAASKAGAASAPPRVVNMMRIRNPVKAPTRALLSLAMDEQREEEAFKEHEQEARARAATSRRGPRERSDLARQEGFGEDEREVLNSNVSRFLKYVKRQSAPVSSRLEVAGMRYSLRVSESASDIAAREPVGSGMLRQSVENSRVRAVVSKEEDILRSRMSGVQFVSSAHPKAVRAYARRMRDLHSSAGLRALVCAGDDGMYAGSLCHWQVLHVTAGAYSGAIYGVPYSSVTPECPVAVVYSSDNEMRVSIAHDRLSAEKPHCETFEVQWPDESSGIRTGEDVFTGTRAMWYTWNNTRFRSLPDLVQNISILRMGKATPHVVDFSLLGVPRTTSLLPHFADDMSQVYWGYMSHVEARTKLSLAGNSPGDFFVYQCDLRMWLALTMRDDEGTARGHGVIQVCLPITADIDDPTFTVPPVLVDANCLQDTAKDRKGEFTRIRDVMRVSSLLLRGIITPHARALHIIPSPVDSAYRAWWGSVSVASAKGLLHHAFVNGLGLTMAAQDGEKGRRVVNFMPFHLFFSEGNAVKCMYMVHAPGKAEEFIGGVPVAYEVHTVTSDGRTGHYLPVHGRAVYSLDDFQKVFHMTAPAYEVRRPDPVSASCVPNDHVDADAADISTFRRTWKMDFVASHMPPDTPSTAISEQVDKSDGPLTRFLRLARASTADHVPPSTIARKLVLTSEPSPEQHLMDRLSRVVNAETPNLAEVAPEQAKEMALLRNTTALHMYDTRGADVTMRIVRDRHAAMTKYVQTLRFEKRMLRRRMCLLDSDAVGKLRWVWGESLRTEFEKMVREIAGMERMLRAVGDGAEEEEPDSEELDETSRALYTVGVEADNVSSALSSSEGTFRRVEREVLSHRLFRYTSPDAPEEGKHVGSVQTDNPLSAMFPALTIPGLTTGRDPSYVQRTSTGGAAYRAGELAERVVREAGEEQSDHSEDSGEESESDSDGENGDGVVPPTVATQDTGEAVASAWFADTDQPLRASSRRRVTHPDVHGRGGGSEVPHGQRVLLEFISAM